MHLAILHQIFNKVEKYGYSSIDSIKSSPADGNTARSFIVALCSNPDSSHVVKFNSSVKYECDVNCIRNRSYKICSHTVAAVEHKSGLRNFVEYFKKHSKSKVNDLVDVNMVSKFGQKKTRRSRKMKPVILHQQYIYIQYHQILTWVSW